MGQQCAPTARMANNISGCVSRSVASKSRELHCCACLWASQSKKCIAILVQVQWRVTKTLRGLQHTAHEERLRELTVKRSNKLPREVVESPSIQLDKALRNLIWLNLLGLDD
ncbi:hypothetical protein QYF61_013102, partial [Mycteria americana]